MSYSQSVALIVPAEIRADANRLACAIGFDVLPGHTFVAPLSADGIAPASHYGAHTYAEPSFTALLQAALIGQLPATNWAPFGLSPQRVSQLFAALTLVSVEATTPVAWAQALAQTGLHSAVEPDPDTAP